MPNRRKPTKNDLRIELVIEILRTARSIAIAIAALEHLVLIWH